MSIRSLAISVDAVDWLGTVTFNVVDDENPYLLMGANSYKSIGMAMA